MLEVIGNRTVTRKNNQYTITIPVNIARDMCLVDKEEIKVSYDKKTKTIAMNKIERIE